MQVTVGFAPEAGRRLGSAGQLEQVHKLAEALDASEGVDLSGLHCVVGAGFGVDQQGFIRLPEHGTALHWAQ